jgi:hypothetical protein
MSETKTYSCYVNLTKDKMIEVFFFSLNSIGNFIFVLTNECILKTI